MSRWHLSSCPTADVVVADGKTPHCRTCKACPDLPRIIASLTVPSSLSIPSDELPGQYDLHWPPTVPYRRHASPPASKPASQTGPDLSATSAAVDPAARSHIYSPLGPDEFRLLRLWANNNNTPVLHIELETCSQARFPEYESVSYTWGGEDNDNSPSQPIFVGPFWDVLLQTANCRAMLESLVPPEGFRLVWVDAICINQSDIKERDSQVAKMAWIYKECRQTVIYLGKDIAPPRSGQHPRRQNLADVAHFSDEPHLLQGGRVNINRLLERRYFSRVWIIQELMLARQMVFQLGDLELWADGVTMQLLTRGPGSRPSAQEKTAASPWDKTAAPWVQFSAQRELATRSNTLLDILQLVARSHSTDPRDKLFGIHGLLHEGSTSSTSLRPNYSLSSRHVLIGLCAHILFDIDRPDMLRLLSSTGACPGSRSPSWVPGWAEQKIWSTISTMLRDPSSYDKFEDPSLNTNIVRKWLEAQHQSIASPGDHSSSSADDRKVFLVVDPGGFATIIQSRGSRIRRLTSNDQEGSDSVPSLEPYARHYWQYWGKEKRFSWAISTDSWINAADGSLSTCLIHLLKFRKPLQKTQGTDSLPDLIYELEGNSPHAKMYIVSSFGIPLDQIIVPGKDHLFVLDRDGLNASCLYMILREAATAGSGYMFVCMCKSIFFESSSLSSTIRPTTEISLPAPPRGVAAWGSAASTTFNFKQPPSRFGASQLCLTDLDRSLHWTLCEVGEAVAETARDGQDWACFSDVFAFQRVPADALARFSDLVQLLLSQDKGEKTVDFLQLYSSCCHQSVLCRGGAHDDEFIEVWCDAAAFPKSEDMAARMMHAGKPRPLFGLRRHSKWQYAIPPQAEISAGNYFLDSCDLDWHNLSVGDKEEIHFPLDRRILDDEGMPLVPGIVCRVLLENIKGSIRQSKRYQELSKLSPACSVTLETETEMAARGPQDSDRLVLWSHWPEEILNEFDVDGRTRRVAIL